MSSGLFKNVTKQTICLQIIYLMCKQDLALNKLQGLICHKIQSTNTSKTGKHRITT